MAAFEHKTQTFLIGVFVLLALCVLECSSQSSINKPTINVHYPFVVGRTKTVTCTYVSTKVANAITFSIDGGAIRDNPTESPVPNSKYITYTLSLTLTPAATDNGKKLRCTAHDGEESTFTLPISKPPDTPIISGPNVINAGSQNYTWKCLVDGATEQAPNVYWQYSDNNKIFSFTNVPDSYRDQNNMQIYNVTSTVTLSIPAGTPNFDLVCVAAHRPTAGNDQKNFPKASKSVQVVYPPVIQGNNRTYPVTEGNKAVTIDCVIVASPAVTSVTWYKDGARIVTTAGSYSGGTPNKPSLVISPVNRIDKGQYRCEATNIYGTTKGNFNTLVVRYLPVVTYSENPASGQVGSSVTLSCVIDAFPLHTTVYWYQVNSLTGRNEVLSIPKSRYSGGNSSVPALTIHTVESTDAGGYRCRADNDVGTGEGPVLKLEIVFKPQITVQPSASGVEPNDVTLQCEVKAVPALSNLVWHKDGAALNTSDPTRFSGGTNSTPSLTILGVGAEDVGSYYCVATNSVGTTTSGTITLTVEYIPVITVNRTQVGGGIGDALTLGVTVKANPGLTSIEWLKRSGASSQDRVVNLNQQGGRKFSGGTRESPSLIIQNLDVSDVGSYKLRVQNRLGIRESGYIEVAVSFAPTTPVISGGSPSYKENDPISLTCSAQGFPEPEYEWFRGSASAGTGASLTIAQASPSDNGQLKCEAYNTKGSASATVDINVLYKPRPGSSLSNVTASIGQTVTLVCDTDSNPDPTGYQWYHQGEQLPSATRQLTVVISNSTMLGSYYCVATNSEGSSTRILVFVSPPADNGGGRVGQSTEDSGLSIATIVLIVIICLIILVVIILIIIYCCTTRRCFKKDNDVAPQRPAQTPVVVPYTAKSADRVMNGYIPPSKEPLPDRIKLDEEKAANGLPPANHGLIISVPGGGTPRPHHLPPLGEDGIGEETESAREEKPGKKKKKRRRHRDEDGKSPRRHRRRHHEKEGEGGNDEAMA